ncbi:scaffolding protein [Streptococcus agalactiae]|uniref:Scaffolding protein n=1 Tax=Streptococcus agalactiae TaxID=1311 RepID=A0A7Z7P5I3_STRAG|nr:scaffolding protein [Streptococcus agalactiae]
MTQIQIKGPIVSDSDRWFYDWLDMPATAPKDVILPQDNSDIEVLINSGGGDVYAGSEFIPH